MNAVAEAVMNNCALRPKDTHREMAVSESATNNGKRIAVSDVDGTLVRGSMVLGHACFLDKEGIVSLGDVAQRWNADQKNEALIDELAKAYQSAIVGKTPRQLHVEDYVQSVIGDSQNFYETMPALASLRQSGFAVHLVSGSPSFLVTPLARAFGFTSKASTYLVDENGAFTGDIIPMFRSKDKSSYIASMNLASKYEYIVGFGDTASDIPIFNLSHFTVLVDPTEVTKQAVGKVSLTV